MDTQKDNSESAEYPGAADAVRHAVEEYPGYESPEERRISDESVRAAVLMALEDLLSHIPSLDDYLMRKQEQNLVERLRNVEERLEQARDRTELPPYSVSIFFSARRLTQEAGNLILANDHELVRIVDRVRELLRETLNDRTDFGALVGNLSALAADLDERLEARLSLIAEFQG